MKPELTKEDWLRPIVVHLCQDGTITYRTRSEPVFNGVALPVFTVNTEEQAKEIQARFCRRQYTEHPQQPGRPWWKWTDFDGDYGSIDGVSTKIKIYYEEFCK